MGDGAGSVSLAVSLPTVKIPRRGMVTSLGDCNWFCNADCPHTQKAETGGWQLPGQLELHSPCLKQKPKKSPFSVVSYLEPWKKKKDI